MRVAGPLPDQVDLGDWRVRFAEGVLAHADREERLEPRVAALLAYLVRHRARLVSREELLSAVWPDVVVAPVALARAVSELRRALHDDPRAPRYIETYPKRGYRLVAPVREVAPARDDEQSPPALPPAAPEARTRKRALGIGVAATAVVLTAALTAGSRMAPAPVTAPSGAPCLAVRSFQALDGDPEGRIFAAGLTEDLLAHLSTLGGVNVLSGDADGGHGRLVASSELRGSVRRVGARVRVVARLVDTSSGAQLWSQHFDRELADVFRAQRDVAVLVTHAVRVRLLGAPLPVGGAAPAQEPTPYDLYRRGQALLSLNSLRSTAAAAEAFEQSLRLDPSFTLGRAGLARALSHQAELRADRRQARAALELARACVAAEPELPEALHALGRSHLVLHEFSRALPAYERALALRPDFLAALHNVGYLVGMRGQLDRAAQAFLAAMERNPGYVAGRLNLGVTLIELGLDDDGRRWLEYALEVDAFHAPTHVALGGLELLSGRSAAARARLERVVAVDPACQPCFALLGFTTLRGSDLTAARRQLDRALELPGDHGDARVLRAVVARRSGDGALAERLLTEVARQSRAAIDDGSEWWRHRWNLAAVAAQRGDAAAAAEWYGRAVDAGHRFARQDRLDPVFDAVRREARFEAEVRRAEGLVAELRRRLGAVPRPPQRSPVPER
jgi:DNA-binding winged helix-turn-helix (wHTH) protein/tetratricopeptide (TPR) repeat protein